jgi:hypothetical protein
MSAGSKADRLMLSGKPGVPITKPTQSPLISKERSPYRAKLLAEAFGLLRGTQGPNRFGPYRAGLDLEEKVVD